MKTFFKYFGAAFGIAFLICSIYVVNLFSSKSFSLDHYLAKELMVSLFDSPEFLTYIGAFDFLNPITKHNSKLSNDSLEDAEESHIDTLKHLQVLNSYEDDALTEEQIIELGRQANLEELRQNRNRRLEETDWTQNPDVPEATRERWREYRQALRDITINNSTVFGVTWPEPPA